jgi:hypothetical protein
MSFRNLTLPANAAAAATAAGAGFRAARDQYVRAPAPMPTMRLAAMITVVRRLSRADGLWRSRGMCPPWGAGVLDVAGV